MPTVTAMVPRDSREMLTEYSREFDQAYALGEVTDWSNVGGLRVQTDALRIRYPIPLDAAGYKEFSGDDTFRELGSRTIEMESKLWQDGVAVNVRKLKAGDIAGYDKAPAAMATEALRHPNIMVAAMLHANPLLDLYTLKNDGGNVASTIRLFAGNHMVHLLKPGSTFSNLLTFPAGGLSLAWAKAVSLHFATIPGPNGRPLGLRWTDLFVPALMIEEAKDFFSNDLIVQAIMNAAGTENVGGVMVKNRYAGTINVTVCDELADTDYIYPLALNKGMQTPWPWIVQVRGTPEEKVWDESSEHCKDTGEVKIAYTLDMAAAAAMPHAIARCART
jgi:hypothetical protein